MKDDLRMKVSSVIEHVSNVGDNFVSNADPVSILHQPQVHIVQEVVVVKSQTNSHCIVISQHVVPLQVKLNMKIKIIN